ncbi:MAG: methyltransferase domain-containing protein [Actinomycetota bacterium]
MTWDSLGQWWLRELVIDPAYQEEIGPLLLDLLAPEPGRLYLDLGCGEGWLMAAVREAGGRVVGCDLNSELLRRAAKHGPVVQAALPELRWLRPHSVDGALVGLVLEHLEDEAVFFSAVAQAMRPGGVLALVINHPIWTAPHSGPIEDAGGETLWRPGTYFGRGHSDEPAGRRKVRFYHRTLADLLNASAGAGWALVRMEERGISPAQVERIADYAGQEHIPRLLGVRWVGR